MRLIFWQITHRFRAFQNRVEVTLAIDGDDLKDLERGEITVAIEAENIKDMTIAEIESLAIARARTILGK